jgi:hypothetical protein
MVSRDGEEEGSARGRLGSQRRESSSSKDDFRTTSRDWTESYCSPMGEGKSEKGSAKLEVRT